MNTLVEDHFAAFFPCSFLVMWLGVTTILGLLSGWFRLMSRFPNQAAEPLLQLRRQSSTMGLGVNMSGVLRFDVCSTGLRIGMMRIFGPFCRNFFVPWGCVSIARKKVLFQSRAKLQFGNPSVGSLTIPAQVANRLALAAVERWPESGPFTAEPRRDRLRRVFAEWAVVTFVAAAFFTVIPMAVAPPGARPPIAVGILFPGIVYGVVAIGRYFSQ